MEKDEINLSNTDQIEHINQLRQKIVKLENENNEIKERFVHLEKLAHIGELTAGILHEIRNPLNFVGNFTKLSVELINDLKKSVESLQSKTDADEVLDLKDFSGMLESNLQKVIENTGRAERIIQGMLAQTRDNKGSFEETALNVLVEESVKLGYQGVRGNDRQFNVTLTYHLDKTIENIKVSSNDIRRVIINLVNNACYAVNEKKKLNIPGYVPEIITTTKNMGNAIEIRIKDTGTGMPIHVREKVFTPFFTTKPVGQGTGLGLSMSLDIIQNLHKGTMEIISEEGKFTEFIIIIPNNL